MEFRRIQISGGLLASLVAVFGEASQLLYLTNTLYQLAGQEAWFAAILGNASAGLICLLGIIACLRHPGLMPGQIARRQFGKWIGGLIALLYGAFFVWAYAMVLRDLLDFAQIVLLPETPAWALTLLVALPTLYMAWEGLEPIARVCFAVLVLKTAATLMVPVMVAKEFSRLQVDPLFYHGIGATMKAAGAVVPWFAECLVVMSIVPNLKPGARAARWFWLGTGLATVLLVALVASGSLVFGADLASRFSYPVYQLVQMVMIGRTIERIEMILVSIWLFGVLMKMSICIYAAASAWNHALGDDSRYRKMAVLATVLGSLLAYLWNTPMALMAMSRTRIYEVGTVAFTVLIPLLLLLGPRRRGSERPQGDVNA